MDEPSNQKAKRARGETGGVTPNKRNAVPLPLLVRLVHFTA